ncbi:MAG: hypothetical protein RSE00_00610 [Clostridia bacterium]
MNNLYLYIENTKINEAVKYGMKLSEYANKCLAIADIEKNSIIAYLSPKDCDLYYDIQYTCLKIVADNLNVYIYNKTCENTNALKHFLVKKEKYKIGDFEEPIAIICSSILPENISIYNKIIDQPVIIENSKDFFYEKAICDMFETGLFTTYELYHLLLILGEQKEIFKPIKCDDKIKILFDKKHNKKYTRKINSR